MQIDADKFKLIFFLCITSYHLIASQYEKLNIKPLGKLIDVGGHKLHFYCAGEGNTTVIVDHSLGGIEGYLLVEELALITKVCIYDRAGYGWSQSSLKPRTSEQIVQELHIVLKKAEIEPPYILLGNSFGSYNMRLYAHHFPKEVVGMVLTDGLHESLMLKMPISLQILKLFFTISFGIASIGAALGIVRFLGMLGTFEFLKKELRKFSPASLKAVKQSFYGAKHWLTMFREMWNLNLSGKQVQKANDFGNLPVINIKAANFLKPKFGIIEFSIPPADKLRDKMQSELLMLSTDCQKKSAQKSGHFVWVDQPEIIAQAVKELLDKLK
ncbi:MAG: alpha/beta hydrolase [Cyanomargarita calcarea GSE-NOS-MK-12-04C]|jgi:pimeloyl-ACP methyl ester carboxylesterase|uniref:Alpha/beta hydrolase n=1 Tax=Cyanomargarita calcarea GSE-NOS-MK-12-04C TaxID=2839659 RepID=A0A951QTL2_9CYAN|nr:alpha/beta hydrolase [Cyanomargarita calcarea GSE-NOS-MK-12-04C]